MQILIAYFIEFLNMLAFYGHAFRLKPAVLAGIIFKVKFCWNKTIKGLGLEPSIVIEESRVSKRDVPTEIEENNDRGWEMLLSCI